MDDSQEWICLTAFGSIQWVIRVIHSLPSHSLSGDCVTSQSNHLGMDERLSQRRCWWQGWWQRGPTVHGRNQLLKQSCWKKNIKRMQPSEIQMEPESTLQKQLQSHTRSLQCSMPLSEGTFNRLPIGGEQERIWGQSPLWLGRAEKDPAQFLRRKVWSSCSRNVLSSFNNKHCNHWGHQSLHSDAMGTSICHCIAFSTCADALPRVNWMAISCSSHCMLQHSEKKKVLQNTAEISVILLRLKRRTYPKPTCSPQLRLRDLLLMWWRRMKAQNPYVNCWILGQTTSWSLQPSAERIITPSGISQGPAGATRYPEGQKWLASSDLARHGIARLPKHQVTLVGL